MYGGHAKVGFEQSDSQGTRTVIHQSEAQISAAKKWYRDWQFWSSGYFSTNKGAITQDIVLQYLDETIQNPTNVSR